MRDQGGPVSAGVSVPAWPLSSVTLSVTGGNEGRHPQGKWPATHVSLAVPKDQTLGSRSGTASHEMQVGRWAPPYDIPPVTVKASPRLNAAPDVGYKRWLANGTRRPHACSVSMRTSRGPPFSKGLQSHVHEPSCHSRSVSLEVKATRGHGHSRSRSLQVDVAPGQGHSVRAWVQAARTLHSTAGRSGFGTQPGHHCQGHGVCPVRAVPSSAP